MPLNKFRGAAFTSRKSHVRQDMGLYVSWLLLLGSGATAFPCEGQAGAFVRSERQPDSAVVRRVIDGDTIQLTDGQLVRYLGIDTPEMRRRVGDQWVFDPEPWAEAAAEANRRLVEGKRVRLAYDAQLRDRFGRLLAYVYIDQQMINEQLLTDGFARPLAIPPDVRYAERFQELAEEAKRLGRGVWASR